MKSPLISIIITSYNYGDYVGQAIESALNQTYENIELIVINDGSTDNSDKIIKKYRQKYPNFVYISQENLGANVSRNKGIEAANGEYIFLLDADNWLNEDHIATLHKVALDTKAEVVYTDLHQFGESNMVLEVPAFDIDVLKVTNFIDTSALITKKSIGGNRFDPWLNRKSSQDWDFFLGLALKGLKIVKAPQDASLNYRVHNQQHGNSFKTVAKIDQSIEAYDYITKKYHEQFPEQFNAQVKWTNNLVLEFAHVKKKLLQIEQELDEKEQLVTSVQNSRSYKIGLRITQPWRFAKKIIKN